MNGFCRISGWGSIGFRVWGLVFQVSGLGALSGCVFFQLFFFDLVFKLVFEATFGGTFESFFEKLLKRVFQCMFGMFFEGSFT